MARYQPSVVARATSNNLYGLHLIKYRRCIVAKETVVERFKSQRFSQSIGLLVNLLEHVVLKFATISLTIAASEARF